MNFNIKLEEIKYVKILYKDYNDSPCITKAGIKKINEKSILACGKLENIADIPTPQNVTLSVVCSDGIYRTKTVLTIVENDDPYTFFELETPQNIQYEQNREYFRVSAEYNCIYKLRENGEEKEYQTKTTDLSANGISIILPNHSITESICDLDLIINTKVLKTKIQYIRSEKVEEGYKISFKFINLSENNRDLISQVCIQKQIEERRHSFK